MIFIELQQFSLFDKLKFRSFRINYLPFQYICVLELNAMSCTLLLWQQVKLLIKNFSNLTAYMQVLLS